MTGCLDVPTGLKNFIESIILPISSTPQPVNLTTDHDMRLVQVPEIEGHGLHAS